MREMAFLFICGLCFFVGYALGGAKKEDEIRARERAED